jgi:hypothetical protein
MAHWFHRNPLKATKEVTFEMKGVLSSQQATKIAGELTLRRPQFLDHLRLASSDLATVESEFKEYLALLHGFLFAQMADPTSQQTLNSKLIQLVRFKWTNSMLGSTAK